MNYEQARQVNPNADRPDAGKWRWTTSNRRTGTYPTGPCSPWETCPDCGGSFWLMDGKGDPCARCSGKGFIDKADPCPGHDTKEEAEEHYRQYRLDHVRFLVLDNPNALHKCRVCGAFTAGVMEIEGDGYFMETVCEEHQTRETAEELIGVISSSMHS